MTLLVPWLAFPAVLVALATGCGLALVRLAPGGSLPGALLLPAGTAVVVVLGTATTAVSATAQLTTPLVVAVAAAGFASSRTLPRLPRSAVAAAIAAFLCFGAPVIVSGSATFAGYVQLDDTATFLALTDRIMEHGRAIGELAPSSYQATLAVNLAHGYPVGSLVPLGVGSELVRSDPAWTYQPYLAFLGALLALSLFELGRSFIRSIPLAALAAAVAAQPALLYGIALWGGVKEMFAAAMLALTAAAALVVRGGGRVAVPVAAAALLDGLSLGAIGWLPGIAIFAVLVRGGRIAVRQALGVTAATAVLALPALLIAPDFLRAANRATFEDAHELGNLLQPLSPFQLLGVWPAGDFRTHPGHMLATAVLLTATGAAAVAGAALSVHRRRAAAVFYLGACAAGVVVVAHAGSPWLEAKVYAVASPSVVLLAMGAGAAAMAARRRVAGVALVTVVAGGVAWSNVLAYRSVSLAPRDELAELRQIGARFAGQGPALMTEYEPYGVRHFLRAVDAEGASELRRRPVPLRSRRLLGKAEFADLDALALDGLLVYRTLVIRRSPFESRPPLVYTRVWSGRFYDVWQRSQETLQVVADLPLGGLDRPAGPAPCGAVLGLARRASAAGGLVAAAPAVTPVEVMADGSVRVPARGRYDAWLRGGPVAGRLLVDVDGRELVRRVPAIEHDGSLVQLGTLMLGRGVHHVGLRLTRPWWQPGIARSLPVPADAVLTDAVPPSAPELVEPRQARRLCGRSFDWIEAVGPSS